MAHYKGGLAARIRGELRRNGLWHSLELAGHRLLARWLAAHLEPSSFELEGRRFQCVYHPHNVTWLNERCVELAVAGALYSACPAARILEVGAVLGHYGYRGHSVMDKFERGADVMNLDVVGAHPSERFDLVVSVSTVEHIGLDDDESRPEKALEALDAIADWLTPTGQLLATFPTGYNPALDAWLARGGWPGETLAMRRIAKHRWEQCDVTDLADCRYGRPWLNGNGLAIVWKRAPSQRTLVGAGLAAGAPE